MRTPAGSAVGSIVVGVGSVVRVTVVAGRLDGVVVVVAVIGGCEVEEAAGPLVVVGAPGPPQPVSTTNINSRPVRTTVQRNPG